MICWAFKSEHATLKMWSMILWYMNWSILKYFVCLLVCTLLNTNTCVDPSLSQHLEPWHILKGLLCPHRAGPLLTHTNTHTCYLGHQKAQATPIQRLPTLALWGGVVLELWGRENWQGWVVGAGRGSQGRGGWGWGLCFCVCLYKGKLVVGKNGKEDLAHDNNPRNIFVPLKRKVHRECVCLHKHDPVLEWSMVIFCLCCVCHSFEDRWYSLKSTWPCPCFFCTTTQDMTKISSHNCHVSAVHQQSQKARRNSQEWWCPVAQWTKPGNWWPWGLVLFKWKRNFASTFIISSSSSSGECMSAPNISDRNTPVIELAIVQCSKLHILNKLHLLN